MLRGKTKPLRIRLSALDNVMTIYINGVATTLVPAGDLERDCVVDIPAGAQRIDMTITTSGGDNDAS